MKVSDVYDNTHHFFRDVFAYWLPGILFTSLLIFRFVPKPQDLDLNTFFSIIDLNIYSFFFLIVMASVVGYLTIPFAHFFFKIVLKVYRWKNKSLDDFVKFKNKLSEIYFKSIWPGEKDISEKELKIFSKNVWSLFAQSEFNQLYLNMIPRFNAMRLFYENLTIIFLISGIMYFQLNTLVSSSFFILSIMNLFFAIYVTQKWEMRRNSFVIIVLLILLNKLNSDQIKSIK